MAASPQNQQRNILVADGDAVLRNTLVGLLKSQGGFLNVLAVNSGKAALKVIEDQTIHIVITGMNMMGMDGFELIAHLGRVHPEIRVIVMTSNASPMMRAEIKQLSSAIHFDQCVDLSLLTKRIFTELHIDYGGQVRGISISSFMQMIELEGRTCTLQISAKGEIGYLTVAEGELIAAATGDLTGRAAALKILAWDNVLIDIDYSPGAVDREIHIPLMSLLLESGRMVDEKKSQRPNQRRHKRFESLVAVDYDISDWTYQCFLKDISMGGAYIETTRVIPVGQKIILSLSSPQLERGCALNGRVVRQDPTGIGVQFDTLSLQQKKVLETLLPTRLKPPHSETSLSRSP